MGGDLHKETSSWNTEKVNGKRFKEEKTGDGLELIQEVQEVQKTAPKFLF